MCVNLLPEMLKIASGLVVESKKTGADLSNLVAKYASTKNLSKAAVNSLIMSANQQYQDLTGETTFKLASRDEVYNILYSSPEKTASVEVDYLSEYATKLADFHGKDTYVSGRVAEKPTYYYKQACLDLLEKDEYAIKKAHAILTGKIEKLDNQVREEVTAYKKANYNEDNFLRLFSDLAEHPKMILKAAFLEAPKGQMDITNISGFEYTKNPTKLANLAQDYYNLHVERSNIESAIKEASAWKEKIASSDSSDLDDTTKDLLDKTASFSEFVSGVRGAAGKLANPTKEYPKVQTNVHSDAIAGVIANNPNLSRAHEIASSLVNSNEHTKVVDGLNMLKSITDQASKHISNTTLNPIKSDPNVYDRFVNAGLTATAVGGTALVGAGVYHAGKKLHDYITRPKLTPEMRSAMIAHVPELQNLPEERLQKHFEDISRLAPTFSKSPTQMAMLINGIKSFGGVTLDTGKSLIDTENKYNQRDSKASPLDSLGAVLSKSIK